jgi:hypothetical protein
MCILNIETFEDCRHGRISTTKCDNPEKQADADKLSPIIVPASSKKQQEAIKEFLEEFGYEVFRCKRYERSEKLWPERSGAHRTTVSIGAQRPKEIGMKTTLKEWSGTCLVNLPAS